MRGVTVALASLLRRLTPLLPADRRDWGEALWSEAGDLPAGPARLSWVVGGLVLVIREADVFRRIGYTAGGLAAGATVVWWGWHPGSANPAMPTDRLALIAVVSVLVLLPWAAGPVLGPVAGNRAARLVRSAGYAAVCLLVLVLVGLSRFAGSRFDHFRAFDQPHWEADMRTGAVVSLVLLLVLVGGYATAILALTARRTSAAPATLAAGAGAGVVAALILYGLMPFGNMVHPDNALLAAGYRIVCS